MHHHGLHGNSAGDRVSGVRHSSALHRCHARAGARLRGVVAPLVGFHLVARFSVAGLGWVSAGLIVLASAILAREIRLGKSPDPGTALVERAAS